MEMRPGIFRKRADSQNKAIHLIIERARVIGDGDTHVTSADASDNVTFRTRSAIREVGKAFVEHGNEFFFVSTDGQTLEGVVTITDLIRGQTGNNATLLTEFMTRNPVVVAAEDDCAIAANAIREYRLKTLPVVERKDNRKLVGCIRVRRMMAFVLKETTGKDGQPTPAR